MTWTFRGTMIGESGTGKYYESRYEDNWWSGIQEDKDPAIPGFFWYVHHLGKPLRQGFAGTLEEARQAIGKVAVEFRLPMVATTVIDNRLALRRARGMMGIDEELESTR